jgi:hypothetical protein
MKPVPADVDHPTWSRVSVQVAPVFKVLIGRARAERTG